MGLLYSNYESNPVTNNNLKIDAVSGTLTKTYQDSYFVVIENGSIASECYFREGKSGRILHKRDAEYSLREDGEDRIGNFYCKLKEIVVLQIMLCPNNNYLVEAIDKEDYDKIFYSEKVEDK